MRSLEELGGLAVEGPDSDGVDLHGGIGGLGVVPRGEPLVLGVPEGVHGRAVHVTVRLVAVVVGEVSIDTTDGDVEDEVEVSVEGSTVGLTSPGVVLGTALASLEEAFLGEVNIEDNVGLVIDVGNESVLSPEETVDVEVVSEGSGVDVLLGGSEVIVLVPVDSPVEGGAEGVVATGGAGRGVASTGLHDVDLSGGGPVAVLVVDGEEPHSGPDHVSLGKLGVDLNSSVGEAEGVDGSDAGGHDGVDDVAVGGVALAAVEGVGGARVSGVGSPDVDVSAVEGSVTDGILGKGRLEVEDTFFNEGVGSVVSVHLELPVAATTHGDFVLPALEIKLVKVVFEDKGLRDDHRGKSQKNCDFHNSIKK